MLDQDNDQIQQRRRHLEEITALGHAAYTNRFDHSHNVSRLVETYRSHEILVEGGDDEFLKDVDVDTTAHPGEMGPKAVHN